MKKVVLLDQRKEGLVSTSRPVSTVPVFCTAVPELYIAASADRAGTDIYVPDFFQKLRHGKPFILTFEVLPSLKFKDQPQVFGAHTIVKKAVIADLLEP